MRRVANVLNIPMSISINTVQLIFFYTVMHECFHTSTLVKKLPSQHEQQHKHRQERISDNVNNNRIWTRRKKTQEVYAGSLWFSWFLIFVISYLFNFCEKFFTIDIDKKETIHTTLKYSINMEMDMGIQKEW